jgi:hypothetical protein
VQVPGKDRVGLGGFALDWGNMRGTGVWRFGMVEATEKVFGNFVGMEMDTLVEDFGYTGEDLDYIVAVGCSFCHMG